MHYQQIKKSSWHTHRDSSLLIQTLRRTQGQLISSLSAQQGSDSLRRFLQVRAKQDYKQVTWPVTGISRRTAFIDHVFPVLLIQKSLIFSSFQKSLLKCRSWLKNSKWPCPGATAAAGGCSSPHTIRSYTGIVIFYTNIPTPPPTLRQEQMTFLPSHEQHHSNL